MNQLIRRMIMIAAAFALALPAATAGAVTDPITQLRTGMFCEIQASPAGFTVRWHLADHNDVSRVIVERRVLGRYWWRGRLAATDSTFTDGVAPTSAARADYRVTTKDAAGAVLDSIDCDLAPTDGLSCVVTHGTDGYHVGINAAGLTAAVSGELDVVVRRSTNPGGTFYWRGRTDELGFDDISTPKSTVSYQIWARADRRIIGAATCQNDLADPACFTSLGSRLEVESLAQQTVVNYNGDLIEQIDALVPDQRLEFVMAWVDSRFVYTRNHDGLSDLYVYDPRDQSNQLIAEAIGPVTSVLPRYVDQAGGVYAQVGEQDSIAYWYFGLGGTGQLLLREPYGTTDLFGPVGDLPDGRTVLDRTAYPLGERTEQRLFSRIVLRTPGTNEFTAVADLDGYALLGVADNGDLLLATAGPLTTVYRRFDYNCIDG